jgi:hypothetical protein
VTQFILLWTKILRSSIWVMESKETRLVWITMLLLKDGDGRVMSSVVGLADMAKVSIPECKKALSVLMAPDPEDSSGKEGGRRILPIDGGWQVVNHEAYQFSTDTKREYWRKKKQAARDKEKKYLESLDKPVEPNKGAAIGGEITAQKLEKLGATQGEQDRHSDSFAPEKDKEFPG